MATCPEHDQIQAIALDKTTFCPEISEIASACINFIDNPVRINVTKMHDALVSAYISLDSKTLTERQAKRLIEIRGELAVSKKKIHCLQEEDDFKTKKISEFETKIESLEEDIAILKVENHHKDDRIRVLEIENVILKNDIKELKDENIRNKIQIAIRQLIVNVQTYIFCKVTGLTQRQLNKEQIRTFNDLNDYICDLSENPETKEKAEKINNLYASIKTNFGLTSDIINSFDVVRKTVNESVHPSTKTNELFKLVKANITVAFSTEYDEITTQYDAELICNFIEHNAEQLLK